MHHLLGNEDLIKINTKQFKIRLLNKAIISTDKLKWQLINLIFPLGLIALLSFSMITYRKINTNEKISDCYSSSQHHCNYIIFWQTHNHNKTRIE